MSASPAGPPSGPPSTTPNGGPAAPIRRKRPQANPFIAKQKPSKRPPVPAPANNVTSHARQKSSATPPVQTVSATLADPDDERTDFHVFPLVTVKKSELHALRHHAMRLMASGEVNPWDPDQFTPPLRLHRRFPRDTLTQPVAAAANGVDDKEREKEAIRKAERQAQREANQAQIAPTEKSAQTKKRQQFKKKVEDVYYPQDTPEAQKRAKLRYEEVRPWHMEDFDGKNTWVGSYEEPLSETHVMLSLAANGTFRMVPVEKWYRFMPTGRYKTMDLDEAEKHMSKKVKDSRWFLENQQGGDVRRRMELERQKNLQRGRIGMRGEQQTRFKNEDGDADMPDFANDVDEIDFEAEDEFQDDDEGKLFGGDEEDIKESERKIRQEMLGANVFAGTGVKEEKDWDAEEAREKKAAADERRRQKKLRKALVKQERKYEYESESDHPYSEESESEDSETERQNEEERKKREDKELKLDGDNPPSGASTGTNTPSGRAEKHGDARNHAAGSSLKRPGSPNLSEASGSESSRKRLKKETHASASSSRAMSPAVDGTRPMSPDARARARAAGSGSDTEASGTERGGKPKNRALASRPGSPIARTPTGSAPGSRPGSPPPAISASASASAAALGLPTADQIRALLPATIAELIRRFRAQIPKTKEANAAFITLVRQVGRNSPQDKTMILHR